MSRDPRLYRRTREKEFSLTVDTSGLDEYLDKVSDGVDKAVRPVAQSMAQVLYDRMLFNVTSIGAKTGNLTDAIYQTYSKDKSSKDNAVYHVSWNKRKAPHGHLLEYGWIQRYAVTMPTEGKFAGRWITLRSPAAWTYVNGKKMALPKPGRNASQAQKDAYWQPREGGPIHHPGVAFVRKTMAAEAEAVQAGKDKLLELVKGIS